MLYLLAALAVALAACGSSGGDAGRSSDTTSPYRIGYIADLSGSNGPTASHYKEAFEAAVDGANSRGGIKGHPLKIYQCDAQSDSNAAAACGQQMVADKVIAVVSGAQEDSMFPYLKNASIPTFTIGGLPLQNTSPNSYVINNIALAGSVGFAALLHEAGCTNIGAVSTFASNAPGLAKALEKALANGAKQYGMEYKGTISAPGSAADLAPYVSQAVSKGMECVNAQAIGAQEISLLQAIEAHPEIKKVIVGVSYFGKADQAKLANPIMQKLGDRAIVLTANEGPSAASTNPAVKQWVEDQRTNFDPVSAIQWEAVQLIVKAATAKAPDVTAKSLTDYLDNLSNYRPGLSPEVSFNKPSTSALGPRVFAAWAAPAKWVDGVQFPRNGPFVSVLTGETNDNNAS